MIHRAKFQNFKALRDVEITFDSRLTVLVGPNGSGKTSVLEGIQFLGKYALTDGPPRRFVIQRMTGPQEVYGWERGPHEHALFDERSLPGAILEVVSQSPNGTEILCRYTGSGSGQAPVGHTFSATQNGNRISGPLPELLQIRSTTLLRLDTDHLRRPSFPTRIPPVTAPDGSGLATALAYLQKKYPEQFEAVIESLRQVIPNVVRIRLDLEQFSGRFGDVLIFDFKGAPDVSVVSASDGTLFVLGLLSVILRPDQPKLILLDDLDHRLHPKAQMQLVDLLRKLLAQFPDLQIIATSHSPYILNKLEWNEVRVTGLKDDGSAICAKLEDHPEVERWREAMTPGEFWSHIGDDWVKKLGKPQAEQPQPAPVAS